MTVNPWPDFDLDSRPRSVKRVVLEQGSGVEAKTGGEIKFVVETAPAERGQFTHTCYLSAPKLNYRYPLLTVTHGLEPYPVSIVSDTYTHPVTVSNEKTLIKELGLIFRSDTTKNLVLQLLDALS